MRWIRAIYVCWVLGWASLVFGSSVTAVIDFSGTSGATPTATTLANGTHSTLSLSWVQDGSATFSYQTVASQPLIGSINIGATPYTDSSTTGMQMSTASSINSDWHWGSTGTALSAGSIIGAGVNISSTIAATDSDHYDVFNLRGFNGTTNQYQNVMLGGDGTHRWISMECDTGQDLSVSQAPISTVLGNVYHTEFIWNPHIGTVTVSGTSVTWTSGSQFDSNLLNGNAKIYINGQATANSYTVASVNSATSLTLVSGPTNGSYSYYAADYMQVYVGWQSPSYPGTIISTQWCASSGVDAGRVDFGNAQGVQGAGSYLVNWDTIMVQTGSPLSVARSPKNCYPASLSAANVQAALTACEGGGVVVLPIGSATWTTDDSVSVTGPLTLVGYTQCTAGCGPQSAGVGLAFSDNTALTLSSSSPPALNFNSCSATNFCRVTGITFSNTTSNSAIAGALQLNGTHGQVSTRVDNLDITNTASTFVYQGGGYGLIDHNLYSGTGDYSFASEGGDFGTVGYLNWQDASSVGTENAYIMENNNFTFNTGSPQAGITDGYFGCKIVIRYNQINGGNGAGLTHGLDSGGYRSCVSVESYNNTYTSNGSNTGSGSPGFAFQSRGGVVLVHDNVFTGPYSWRGIELDYYRGSAADVNGSGWGFATPGINWTPSVLGGSTSVANPHPPNWVASHAYGTLAVVIASGANYINQSGSCTSGGSTPSTSMGNTVSDGGCTWLNGGGSTGSPPGSPGTNAGFLSTDNETACTSGSTCTRFLDTNNTGYPYRDQPCMAHGQVVAGCYQWNNSGSQVPTSWWGSDSPSIVQLNRDYFSATPSGYTPYTYPHPLDGASSPIIQTPTVMLQGVVLQGVTVN